MQFVPSGGQPTEVTDGTSAVPHTISYATGKTIHVGQSVLDVGHPIRAYVQTDLGYAFTSTDRDVYTFIDGTAERVGSLGHAVDMEPNRTGRGRPARRLGRRAGRRHGARRRVGRGLAHGRRGDRGRARCAPGHGARRHYCVLRRRPRRRDLGLRDRRGDGRGAEQRPGSWMPRPTSCSRRNPGTTATVRSCLLWDRCRYHSTTSATFPLTAATSPRSTTTGRSCVMPTPAPNYPSSPAHDWALGYQWLDDDTFRHDGLSMENDSGSGYGRPSLLTCSAVTRWPAEPPSPRYRTTSGSSSCRSGLR